MFMGAKPGPRQGGGTAHQASGELRAEDDDRPTTLRWAVTGCHKQVVHRLLRKKSGYQSRCYGRHQSAAKSCLGWHASTNQSPNRYVTP